MIQPGILDNVKLLLREVPEAQNVPKVQMVQFGVGIGIFSILSIAEILIGSY